MTRPTQVIFLRHAHSSANARNILAGRDNTVTLSPKGMAQAQALIPVLGNLKIDQIVTSPLLRCRQTIDPFLKSLQSTKQLSSSKSPKPLRESDLIEMEYGEWTGKSLLTLSRKPLWKAIQGAPSRVRFPGGESFTEMQDRAKDAVERHMKKGKTLLIVSHGDVIKSLVAHYLGLHLDNFQRISIDPASLTSITFNGLNQNLNYLNLTSDSVIEQSFRSSLALGGGSGASKDQ